MAELVGFRKEEKHEYRRLYKPAQHAFRSYTPVFPVTMAYEYVSSLMKKREKERITVDDGEKWVKPHASVRQRRVSRLQQPLSHSHEEFSKIFFKNQEKRKIKFLNKNDN
ncbi:hypothetical protein KUTeg_005094 [Tegillarca granosa]|uniref:Uncharacterized protein n=1 Tax=Tegillarca granosa TaxID=220873 RepID=A0ABQ9FNA3_TEGGR|nr:hypothetical protein KUTeg_005094 [Tegillarca granosa]